MMKYRTLILATLTLSLGLSACQPANLSPSISVNPKTVEFVVSDLDAELQASLEASVTEQGVPGAVLYLQTPDGVWVGAAGVKDLGTQSPMKPTDHFRIASITKMFVAVSVLQLVEAGKISLEDPLTKLLPNTITQHFPYRDQITLRHLLNHTSGLSDYLDNDQYYEAVEKTLPDHIWTAEEVIRYAYDLSPQSPPRKHHYYSNTNYILLELIIEKITGNSLAQELRDRIHTPLNLQHTFMENRESRISQGVHGYGDWDTDGKRDDVTSINDGLGLGDGGLISTVADLATFIEALLVKKTLLKPATLAEMLTFIDDGEGGDYGLGIMHWEDENGEGFGHTGQAGGFLSTLWYLPEQEVIAVAFTNDEEQGEPDDIVYAALEILK